LIRNIYIYLAAGLLGVTFFTCQADDFDADLAERASAMSVWHVADGLPSDSVTAIVQTRDGFLWIGTSAGLSRFDGVKFTLVRPPDPFANNLTGITALCEDSNGHLWIGTQQNGLFQLADGQITHYGRAQGLLDNNVTSLAADGHGQVWIGGNSGLSLWTGQHFSLFTKRDGLPDEAVSGVNVARSGAVWITTRVGMCQFIGGRIVPYAFQTESQGRSPEYLGAYEDRRGNLWAFGDTYLINLAEGKRFNYFRSSEPASVRIWSLCEGHDGRLWIGTSGRGLFCFEDNRFQPVILSENRWPYDVRAICEDHEGNLWLGTSGGGLVQLRLQSVHVLRGGQGLPEGKPTALALDADGRIYVGLQRGGLWVGEAGRFDQIGGSDGLELQNFISSVAVARDGTVWAGTLGDGVYGLRGGRGIHFTTANGLANNTVLAVSVDAEDNVWVSTSAGSVHRFGPDGETRFDAAQGLPGTPVTAMIPAATGGLWLGTGDGQILREKKGGFVAVRAANGFPVSALYEDDLNRLWIGTTGGGLDCLVNGTNLNWSTINGLPGNDVSGVIADRAKNLWLVTDAGIYRVGHEDISEVFMDHRLPLNCKLVSPAKTSPDASMIFGARRAALAADGSLWFATSEGMLNVDTHQTEIEPTVFPVYIENATVNGGPPLSLLPGRLWSPAPGRKGSFLMPVDLRSLEIHFTALNFITPGEVQFRYKLEGLNSDWVDDAGGVRLARYERLLHGNYRFRVAARFADGPWQEAGDSFAFTVPTHIYFQTWAIGLYVFAAVALITGIVRMISHRRLRNTLARLEQQQSLERERMRIARDMHDEMGSKLTKISFLSERVQMDAGDSGPFAGKIQSIAQTSRELLKTMDEIVWVVNPRNDTLENLVAYLSHYAVEYFQNTSVECEVRVSPDVPHYPLSSEIRHNLFLTFEEALNNVLKHSGAAGAKVEMIVHGLEFELKITDNGRGFAVSALPPADGPARGGRGGNGLKNMRQRLTAVGGECTVSSRPGMGTVVTIRIRLAAG
jgi:ligand-binding sensor domain-containing protein/signal transduction histidine kinase